MDIIRSVGRQMASGRPGGALSRQRQEGRNPLFTSPGASPHLASHPPTALLSPLHCVELVVGNMVRRILRLVREAYAECAQRDLSTKEPERGAVDPILSLHVSYALRPRRGQGAAKARRVGRARRLAGRRGE